MYETVKIINGHDIYRMKGTHGFYWVDITAKEKVHFKTIEAAAAWIVANL